MKLRDTLRASREQNVAGLAQQLVQSRPDIDLATLGVALKDVYPQLGEALTAGQAAKTQTTANTMLSQVNALRKAGNVKAADTLVAGLPPEIQEEIRKRTYTGAGSTWGGPTPTVAPGQPTPTPAPILPTGIPGVGIPTDIFRRLLRATSGPLYR
jgi:hypothetical protein